MRLVKVSKKKKKTIQSVLQAKVWKEISQIFTNSEVNYEGRLNILNTS